METKEKRERDRLDRNLERAIVFLVVAMEHSGNNPKPVILHSIRVAFLLGDQGCDPDIVIAGALHDLIEDSATTLNEIERSFGASVAQLVSANTFDKTIEDRIQRDMDMLERCQQAGKDALLIKAADILENSYHFQLDPARDLDGWLLKKMGLFLEMSRKELEGSVIWERLKMQHRKLAEMFDGDSSD